MISLALFDRATDSALQTPYNAHGLYSSQDTLDLIIESILKNIECILQTHCFFQTLPSFLTELNTSVLTYGIEDFSSLSIYSAHDLNKARFYLEKAISLYEPRLKNVKVILKNKESAVFFVKAELQNGDSALELTLAYADSRYTVQNIKLDAEGIN